jgi:parallel beta-helix repeat protein
MQEKRSDSSLFKVLDNDSSNNFKKYVPHEPISIKGDTDFTVLQFPGNGSSENPYIIEGFNITGSFSITRPGDSTESLIHIEDTTVYFHIRANFLNGAIDGIHLENTPHGTVEANFITNCYVGIEFKNVRHGLIEDNIVTNCRTGISL